MSERCQHRPAPIGGGEEEARLWLAGWVHVYVVHEKASSFPSSLPSSESKFPTVTEASRPKPKLGRLQSAYSSTALTDQSSTRSPGSQRVWQ